MRQLIFLITLLALLAACTTYQYFIICKRPNAPAVRRNETNSAVSFVSFKIDTSYKTVSLPQTVIRSLNQKPLCRF
jgi:hypothetical protein